MILYFAFSGLLNFIVSIFLACLVYLKGKRIFANKIFVLDAISVALWSFGYFFWQISTNETSALFWSRVLMAGAIFIPVFYFHFIVSFLNLIEKYKKILLVSYGLSVFFFLVNFTPYFVKNVEPELFFPFWPKPGIFYHPFLLMFFSFVVYGWYLLLKALQKTEEKIRKQQIKYFLLGTGIGFICGSTNYFLWYEIPIPPYLNIFVSLYVILTTFAILKYHLFEIRVILTEILVGLMGIILLILLFLMPSINLRLLTFFIFIVFLIFARYLLKAIHEEERRREEAEKLAEEAQIIAVRANALKKSFEEMAERERKLRLEIERLSDAKDQFILSTQHYFRTPLASIIGYLSLILEGVYGEVPSKLKEKIFNVFTSAKELQKRIEEGLSIAAFQIGKEILNLKETQLEDLVKKVYFGLKVQADIKKLEFKLKLPEDPLPKIKIDPERIEEVFTNLIDNAIKYTEKGKIEIELKKEGKVVLFSVKDTGIGISPEELQTIGQSPFERGKKGKKVALLGKGIGLYLSRLIVKAHQGKLWVESEGEGKGSTFYVRLPIKNI